MAFVPGERVNLSASNHTALEHVVITFTAIRISAMAHTPTVEYNIVSSDFFFIFASFPSAGAMTAQNHAGRKQAKTITDRRK
jgi:hypothetical protein